MDDALHAFQLELVMENRRFLRRGLRKVIQKKVEQSAYGGYRYYTYDGIHDRWSPDYIRMNARQLRDQRKGILSGCVEGCQVDRGGDQLLD
jgi:hypothetical protein